MKMKKQCLMIKNRKIVILHKNVYTKFVTTIKNKKTVYVNFELPKSFVVCRDKIYICPLNTSTLIKRVQAGQKG
jgi:hypothetical protein